MIYQTTMMERGRKQYNKTGTYFELGSKRITVIEYHIRLDE